MALKIETSFKILNKMILLYRVISSDEERAFLQEKIVTLIQNERNLEDSLQKQTNQYIHKFDEQQRQIDELTKSKEVFFLNFFSKF